MDMGYRETKAQEQTMRGMGERVFTWVLVALLLIIGWSLLGVIVPIVRDFFSSLRELSYFRRIQTSAGVLALVWLWVLFMVLATRVSYWRGRNGVYWAWLGPIALAVLPLLPMRARRGVSKRCPECAEVVQAGALRCRYCAYVFEAGEPAVQTGAVPQPEELGVLGAEAPAPERLIGAEPRIETPPEPQIPAERRLKKASAPMGKAERAYRAALDEADPERRISLLQEVVRQYLSTEWADHALESIVELKERHDE